MKQAMYTIPTTVPTETTSVKWTQADSRRAWRAVTGYRMTHGKVTMRGIELAEYADGADEDAANVYAAIEDLSLIIEINEGRIANSKEHREHCEKMGWDWGWSDFNEKLDKKHHSTVRAYRKLIEKIKVYGMPPRVDS